MHTHTCIRVNLPEIRVHYKSVTKVAEVQDDEHIPTFRNLIVTYKDVIIVQFRRFSGSHHDLEELGHWTRSKTSSSRLAIERNSTTPGVFLGFYYCIQAQTSKIRDDSSPAISRSSKAMVGDLYRSM